MLRQDVPVWYRFLDELGHLFNLLYYDVLLGGPTLSPEEAKDPMKCMWRANTAKRADVIWETDKEVWIIEVASDLKPQHLGQLLVYESLWLEDPKISKPLKLALVIEHLDLDMLPAIFRRNIQLHQKPAPGR